MQSCTRLNFTHIHTLMHLAVGNPASVLLDCAHLKKESDTMLIDSDCGLNLALGFDDSLQKVLMRTMLIQEEIFRSQVLELHRLYDIQKILMKEDFKVTGGDCTHSFDGPFSKNLKYESQATKMKLSEADTISLKYVKNNFLKERMGTLKHQQLSLDLKLGRSHYTSNSEDLLCDCITPEVSALIEHTDDKESSIEVLKLSQRAEADTWQKGSGNKTCKDKFIFSPLPQAICLEESTYGGDVINIPAHGYATHATYSGAKNEFEMSRNFRRVEQCHEDLSCKSMLARGKLFTSHEGGVLDLNKALPDESSTHPIDLWTFNPSQCTSSGVSHNEAGYNGKNNIFTALDKRQSKNKYSTESSALARQDITVSTLTTSRSKDTGVRCKSTLCSVDFGSVCGPLEDSKDPVNGFRDTRPQNAESEIHLPDKTCLRKSMAELNVKKKNNEGKLCSQYLSQELLEGADSNRSPVSCISDWIMDDVSSNTKTGQPVIDMSKSNVLPSTFQNSESSPVPKQHVQHYVMPSSEMKSQSSAPAKEELAEVDVMVRQGAVSLIYFSLERSARNQDDVPESRKRKENCNADNEVPETSSESYESIVLKQAECRDDEYCVSSTAFEVTSLDAKDHGIKVKRGRRMKDFRKEILPGLASLSRQEIGEDIKIMELALRSREYKKYRSKTATKIECISQVRSRRSGLRYVGQRHYS